jgi:hypothetical protein
MLTGQNHFPVSQDIDFCFPATLGCANEYSAEVKCHYARYSEHSDAWSIWFSGEGTLIRRVIQSGSCLMILIYIHCLYGLEQVFSIFEDLGISVDCVATSEVSISVTLDPSKIWSRELIQQASASSVK